MANHITYDRRPDFPDLDMSNAASEVFWDLLRLAAETRGSPPDTATPLGWLLARAPGIDGPFGMGLSGFDLDEMPWRDARLEQDRSALLRTIDRAAAGAGWDRLDYRPDPGRARAYLAAFRALVAGYEPPVLGGSAAAAALDCGRSMAFIVAPTPLRRAIIGRYLRNAGALVAPGNAFRFPDGIVVTPRAAAAMVGELGADEHIVFVTAEEGRLRSFLVSRPRTA